MTEKTLNKLTYKAIFNPSPEDLGPINRGFHEFTHTRLGTDKIDEQKLAILARDEDYIVIGGIHGELSWDWLYIQTLWVHADYRGKDIGTRLLTLMEKTATSKNIYHSHLETSDFMALKFYVNHGYEVFGKLEGKPAGSTWYYMKKEL